MAGIPRRTWNLARDQRETKLPIELGTLVRARTTDDGAENTEITGVENNIRCSNGPHLHQGGYNGTNGGPRVIYANRDDSRAGWGIPNWPNVQDDFNGCVSSSMWFMKVASSAPSVTATKKPTVNVCPSTLTVQTGASVGTSVVHGGAVSRRPGWGALRRQ